MDLKNIPAFCINLDFRKDRWAKCEEEFSKINLNAIRHSATYFVDKNPYPKINIRTAGCYDSHINIWKKCISENIKIVVIFEDDIVFPSDFKRIFPLAFDALPKDFDIWQFHSCHSRHMAINKYISKITGRGWGTHAYIITLDGCKKMLDTPVSKPIDTTITTSFQENGGKLYGINNEYCLCFQSGEDSNNIDSGIGYWKQFKNQFYR